MVVAEFHVIFRQTRTMALGSFTLCFVRHEPWRWEWRSNISYLRLFFFMSWNANHCVFICVQGQGLCLTNLDIVCLFGYGPLVSCFAITFRYHVRETRTMAWNGAVT
jgi:hypothetical protein